MCYCQTEEAAVLDDIARLSVPEDALVSPCCWSYICEVRGRNPESVDGQSWRELCKQRGHIL